MGTLWSCNTYQNSRIKLTFQLTLGNERPCPASLKCAFFKFNFCTVWLNALQCTSKENAEHKGSTNNNNEETTNPMKRPQIKSKCCFALRKSSCKKNHIWVTSIQPKYPPPANPLGKHCFPNVTGGNGKSCTLADCMCEFV